MASGDKCKWPGPVTFDDSTPKDGYCTIHLKIPGLKVSGGLFGGGKPKNADVQPEIAADKISISVKVEGGEEYAYVKQLLEDIDKSKSEIKYKDGRVVVKLCKVKAVSWGAHAGYLIMKE